MEPSLPEVLASQGVAIADEPCQRIQRYCELLWDWNTRLNLTRHTTYEKFVARDVVDTLQLADCLEPHETVMDVGSGGGVPGVLLAILRPDVQVTLCEPINKKARALADMVQRLELPCVVVASRVQDILGDSRFDVLVARAVGSMGKVLGWLQPHWNSVGRLLLIKGPRWVEERHEARQRGRLSGLELRRVRTYRTPLTEAESVILLVRRAS